MAAKIIPFPAPLRSNAEGPRDEAPGRPLDLIIEVEGGDPSFFRNASVRADDSLADLHGLITKLFNWDDAHNYFFSHGSCRYEDPELYRSQDRLSAHCRKIYSAADVPVGRVLGHGDHPLFYVYNLAHCWELRISCCERVPLEQFG